MRNHRPLLLVSLVWTMAQSSQSRGQENESEDEGSRRIERVLLISVDGLHQTDLAKFIADHRSSTLARLAHRGVQYTEAHTTTPSDSFPGLLALVTGGTPRTTGVYYDDSYDRTLLLVNGI